MIILVRFGAPTLPRGGCALAGESTAWKTAAHAGVVQEFGDRACLIRAKSTSEKLFEIRPASQSGVSEPGACMPGSPAPSRSPADGGRRSASGLPHGERVGRPTPGPECTTASVPRQDCDVVLGSASLEIAGVDLLGQFALDGRISIVRMTLTSNAALVHPKVTCPSLRWYSSQAPTLLTTRDERQPAAPATRHDESLLYLLAAK